MALPSLQFLAGLLLLLYLLSFVLFAFIRVVTGVSIQRLGYSGLRRIAFHPKDGLRIEIRGLGFSLHRPTFAQPTWVSIVLTELKVTVDLKALGEKPQRKPRWASWPPGSAQPPKSATNAPDAPAEDDDTDVSEEHRRSLTWKRLTDVKEKIKRLHSKINYICLVDLLAYSTSIVVRDVGSVQVGNMSLAVDTRRKTVDRSRLFNHRKLKSNQEQRPAEWYLTLRSVLFTPEGGESTEVLDHCTLNIHGFLKKELEGLRDASIALKLGRLSIPYDDVKLCVERAKKCRPVPTTKEREHNTRHPEVTLTDVVEELDHPGSREESIVQTVSDSREFASSILRGIHEFQFAISFVGLTKQIRACRKDEPEVYLNVAMKEVGMDLLRLDPRSPAHLMYFSPNDIAHQALLAAISISVGIDDGSGHPERLLYVPMATTTLNTTLPSKTIQFSSDKNSAERNTNILFANLVVTSPSLDLDPKHLPLLLSIFNSYESRKKPKKPGNSKRYLIRRLLPKANIKISIHEPVIRVTLPPMDPERQGTDEFDLLISASSSLSLDVESSHAADGELHYALLSTFRMNAQQLYYQTASIEKHSLLLTDYLEFKMQLSASPHVTVELRGMAQTFSFYLVRPEISEGLRQIVTHLQKDNRRRRGVPQKKGFNFLRKLPQWLAYIHLQGSDFNIEVAGVDEGVSKHSRGLAIHLESWTAEYKHSRDEENEMKPVRRRAPSRTINRDEHLIRPPASPSSKSPQKSLGDATDGRRLALHFTGLEAFVIETEDQWEQDPSLSLPRMEIAFSTLSDKQGPMFHVHSFSQRLYLRYSLYRHFAMGMAMQVLRRSFVVPQDPVLFDEPMSPMSPVLSPMHLAVPSIDGDLFDPTRTGLAPEIVTIDFKAQFVQIKADMPSDPPLMLQIYGIDAGRHRWQAPFLRSRLIRLYAENPNIKRVWSRIVSVKSLRLDYRQTKRRYGHTVTDDKSIDIATDAIRIAIPHQLVVHKIFDNVTNITKVAKQMQHRFNTGTNEYVLDKEPEGPKHVPKISLRSRAVLFELEDSSFEWKLGTIYRIGLMEQKQRLAREQAFELKVKKLQQEDELRNGGGSRHRARSAHNGFHGHRARNKSKTRDTKHGRFHRRTKSADSSERGSLDEDRPMRYNKDGFSGLSGSSQTSVEVALEKLKILNAQTWKKRIDHALATQTHSMHDIRSMFWGLDELPDDIEQTEVILTIPQRPALMALAISDLDILIDKPSFPMSEYPKFLQRVGKGMPTDMQYSLLIPMHVQINAGEAKLHLRDYPLPLVHIPSIGNIGSSRLPSLSLKTDFVIAEEFRDVESSRVSRVVVVPKEETLSGEPSGGFAVDVRRTVAPVKTYSDMNVDINSAYPTRITWGTSYQPAIQDMMQIIENFTKPAVDPSERVGFWDKIRLTFHSRINISWKGDGDVHLILKGSRDPYMVTGHGAGFVMCWQNDVRLTLAEDEDPRNFMVVKSGSYVLAIPDLSHYARHESDAESSRPETSSSSSSRKQLAVFKKTVMKLNGNVRWGVGLVFERNLDSGGRSFDFIPHYNVALKNPKYAKPSNGKEYDAFRGFRSHHIHMSIAIAAPYDREWSVANQEASKTYNSVHLTPRFFTHFYNWWSMFSGAMSLPVRQGHLWPGVEKSSKKFGRHLATIKYNLLLSPLYMSHIYKHKDAEDYNSGVVSATGLKARVDSFMLDFHQRREEFRTVVQAPQGKEDSKQNQTTGMRINQVQLDLIKTDVRAVSASIAGTDSDDVENGATEETPSFDQHHLSADLSKFTIPDNDWGWVDMDDFIELGWILPSDRHPETQILPLAFAPHFTYFRQTDHADNISGDVHRTSAFGSEPTHHCVMSARNDPRRIQCGLIEQRIERIKKQIEHNHSAIGEQEVKVVRELDENQKEAERRLNMFKSHAIFLQRKLEFLTSMHESLLERLAANEANAVPEGEPDTDDEFYDANGEDPTHDPDNKGADTKPNIDYISDFNNRFIIHNVHLKWGNSLRNIILRYIHQVSQRRGFVYYMSRRAVKFILDVVDEQNKSRGPSTSFEYESPDMDPTTPKEQNDQGLSIDETIQQLLADGKKFVAADETEDDDKNKETQDKQDSAEKDVNTDYVPQNAYIVRLIAPQIQLQSERNTKAAVLVTAKGMQLKVLQIMDKDRVMDEVSGLVQRRFTAAMDSLQIFVTNAKIFSGMDDIHMYSGSTYGTPAGSAWPPWVPFEVMFEFHTNPYGFQRVVQRTSASMRYDKYNTLRLKYNDDVSGDAASSKSAQNMESRIDHLWVDFPHVRALCDSRQYYAVYVIVLDLLLYREPLEKTRNERLEKIMLASDFSDLTGAPNLVIGLQERIRQLEEIKTVFQVNEKYLDKQGWEDRVEVEKDLTVYEDELFFVMKAITTAQRKQDDRAQAKQSTGLLRWYISASEIVWHLLREGQESLAEFQLKNALYDRTDNNDGSNFNTLEIEDARGLNLLPNALYPEMILPYLENNKPLPENAKCLKVQFVMLEAIAGIPVMEHFEVILYPLKVQLEWEIGKKLFEYVFPAIKDKDGEAGSFSPFMIKHTLPQDGEDDELNGSMLSGVSNSLSSSMLQDEAAAALQSRLTPTLNLPDPKTKAAIKVKSSPQKRPGLNSFRSLFRDDHGSRSGSELRRTLHPSSAATPTSSSLNVTGRPGSVRSNMSSMTANESERTAKKFTLYRTGTGMTMADKRGDKKKERHDDLTQMMNRASNYMTLAYVRIPSMTLCLSYKGKGSRNFEDVHDLVFKMPTLEYRNKTWSNLDLALQLKKDVIRALISHAGAIVGNKFSHHRPSKTQQLRLRQIANSSAMLNASPDPSSDGASGRDHSPGGSSTDGVRRSFTSGRQGSFVSTVSEESSLRPGTSADGRSTHGSILGGIRHHQNDHGLGIEDGRAFADELSRVDNTEPGHANIIHSLSKHITSVTPFANHSRRDRANSTGHNSSFPFSRNGSVAEMEHDRPVTSHGDEGEQLNKKQKALAGAMKLLGRTKADRLE
ncbi:mitochondrial protein from FMP27-domain-containing protein [Boeremia exigua]|uniref:mitochondrial protein from FMP27-domain-containing protein n=1 Tax=Boeremia exigua TaxID=749465 RepID=UPI001E8D6186|nr:mitochondrial protein from FMP27-domain-containing protein [Boeremia exigua]KAH6625189.1 mitochondrial protein from FMP27-domain-containing protein [Boeremia exigua]